MIAASLAAVVTSNGAKTTTQTASCFFLLYWVMLGLTNSWVPRFPANDGLYNAARSARLAGRILASVTRRRRVTSAGADDFYDPYNCRASSFARPMACLAVWAFGEVRVFFSRFIRHGRGERSHYHFLAWGPFRRRRRLWTAEEASAHNVCALIVCLSVRRVQLFRFS